VRDANGETELLVQAQHQPIARTRAELGREIKRTADADHHHPAQHQRPLCNRAFRVRDEIQRHVGHRSDAEHIEDRTDSRLLPERQPEQHDRRADDHGRGADPQPRLLGDALMEGVPRAEAQIGAHHHGNRQAVAGKAGEQEDPAFQMTHMK